MSARLRDVLTVARGHSCRIGPCRARQRYLILIVLAGSFLCWLLVGQKPRGDSLMCGSHSLARHFISGVCKFDDQIRGRVTLSLGVDAVQRSKHVQILSLAALRVQLRWIHFWGLCANGEAPLRPRQFELLPCGKRLNGFILSRLGAREFVVLLLLSRSPFPCENGLHERGGRLACLSLAVFRVDKVSERCCHDTAVQLRTLKASALAQEAPSLLRNQA